MARNSPFLKAEVGDIVHFSRFYNVVENYSWERDVWAVVTNLNDSQICIEKFTGKSPGCHDADETDTGRIVKPDKVPDHIWAALAKWRLIGADPA